MHKLEKSGAALYFLMRKTTRAELFSNAAINHLQYLENISSLQKSFDCFQDKFI